MRMRRLCSDRLRYTVAGCVHEDNRQRAEAVDANTPLLPARASRKILVCSRVASGFERILANLLACPDDHPICCILELKGIVGADLVSCLINDGMGTVNGPGEL